MSKKKKFLAVGAAIASGYLIQKYGIDKNVLLSVNNMLELSKSVPFSLKSDMVTSLQNNHSGMKDLAHKSHTKLKSNISKIIKIFSNNRNYKIENRL